MTLRERIRGKIEETFRLCYVHRDSLADDIDALLGEAADKFPKVDMACKPRSGLNAFENVYLDYQQRTEKWFMETFGGHKE